MGRILDTIDSPSDLKNLKVPQLEELAGEIREILVNTVAENGGHLAANLGVVELTLALHHVLDTPRDKIIWDVGHQCYTHKVITGRKNEIHTLRRFKGLSGFPKVEESIYDVFNTGHSSTSISAALGMALARDLQRERFRIVAVIGDGALTGGMAFEALNHAGHQGCDLTVVLNDNEMSISRNVGALSTYLSNLRSDPAYFRRKAEIESWVQRIPGIGPNIVRVAEKLKDSLKYLIVPGMLFEELGFTYIGPIDGHNLQDLITVLGKTGGMKGPVLIHVITQKGRGYEPALAKPDEFHGIGPFNVDTGLPLKPASVTYTQVFGDFMVQRASQDPRVVAITAAMTSGTGLSDFARRFPDRFFDVGICEQHAVTLAAGMARMGLRPVVAIYSTFLQRAYDQIVHDVCLQNLPVVFAVDRAGLVGEDGPTHHGVFDLSYLRHVPNLVVMAPSDENELADMLYSAFSYDMPVAVRYPRGSGEGVGVKKERKLIHLPQARIIREGRNMLFLGIGRGVGLALRAAEILQEQGIEASVVDARFVKPLDRELLGSLLRQFERVVTVEDNVLHGGFGSAVLEMAADLRRHCNILRVGVPDRFIEHGSVDALFDELGMDASGIVAKVMETWPELTRTGGWRILRFGEK
ncbi:1-deoxy-D-xylulose-5-phosphate synthase [Syntrophothermus lipocalidus]|uniref:1-deoxy-D-xylulose-5-phosphate synthase n=1 Tax=Syntrophothermus lipocalidus (strain DSM 12680 / TGB-C1) TaxID=643648 RepID=D7CKI3_SYNLT|nr:1-deoxy-D-xylulose-5-phosphate synthase [Syntrophothermus lipocalidus]ADI01218.1 deoxyxylulose-5-phosphate synthase [Syntrophothermus lipocalidus DSM 12680]